MRSVAFLGLLSLLAAQGVFALTASQQGYANTIIQVSLNYGTSAPTQACVTAITTALDESTLRNLANNAVPASLNYPHNGIGKDHDSIGLFQQRPSEPQYSSVAADMDPAQSTRQFLAQMVKISGWQTMDPGVLAQKVQRSATPTRYEQFVPQARQICATGGAGSGGGGTGGGGGPGGGGSYPDYPPDGSYPDYPPEGSYPDYPPDGSYPDYPPPDGSYPDYPPPDGSYPGYPPPDGGSGSYHYYPPGNYCPPNADYYCAPGYSGGGGSNYGYTGKPNGVAKRASGEETPAPPPHTGGGGPDGDEYPVAPPPTYYGGSYVGGSNYYGYTGKPNGVAKRASGDGTPSSPPPHTGGGGPDGDEYPVAPPPTYYGPGKRSKVQVKREVV